MELDSFNDLSRFVDCTTVKSITVALVNNFILRRKELKISQKELANRSGVSYASIRRFEATGKIAFQSLLSLAQTINCLDEFARLFTTPRIANLKERYEKEYK